MVIPRSASIALAALLACGCELMVGTEDKSLDVNGGDGAAAGGDAATADGGADGTAADAGVADTLPVEASACQTCGGRLTTCQAQCAQTSTMCQSQCSDNGCVGKCTKTEMQCNDGCTMSCMSCAQVGGCGDMSACHPGK